MFSQWQVVFMVTSFFNLLLARSDSSTWRGWTGGLTNFICAAFLLFTVLPEQDRNYALWAAAAAQIILMLRMVRWRGKGKATTE